MTEQVLSTGDRAALQSLVALAGAVGVGTIFALFFAGRKRTGYVLFEVFATAFILAAAAVTAYIGLVLLHENKEIADSDLTTAATPLLVATFLLILLSVISKLPDSDERLFTMLPIALGLVCMAALLSLLTLRISSENASALALGVLVAGGVVAFSVEVGDRHFEKRRRRAQAKDLRQLLVWKYLPDEKPLRFAVPRRDRARPLLVHCWIKQGGQFLDLNELRRLRRVVDGSWDALHEGRARPPVGSFILTRVEIRLRIPFKRQRVEVRFHVVEAGNGTQRAHSRKANKDGVFDVTNLQLL